MPETTTRTAVFAGAAALLCCAGLASTATAANAAARSEQNIHALTASTGSSAPDLRAAFHQAAPSGTRTVYVEADGGSDANDGTTDTTAYATIQHAVDEAQAGDRILVGAGTYGYLSVYGYRGTSTRWLSIESRNDQTHPLISVADNSGNDGVDIQQSSYVGLYGFEVKGLQTSSSTNPSGVAVFRAAEHIDIWNNNIHDFPGGGVNDFYIHSSVYNGETLPAGGWDLVDVSFNRIHETSKYSPSNTSGISFYGAVDTSGSTLAGGYGYRAVGNYIYDVICTVNSSSGAGNFNFVTDGNGISIDSLSQPYDSDVPSYTKRGLVEANVLAGNGGRAVHVFNSINVDGLFNTAVGNLRTNSPAINGGVEFDSNITNGDVNYYGNIIVPLNTTNSTDAVSTYSRNVITGGTQAVSSANIDRTSQGSGYLQGAPTAASAVSSHPMSYFTPVTADRIAAHSGMTGYQALNSGALRTGSTIPAGALGT